MKPTPLYLFVVAVLWLAYGCTPSSEPAPPPTGTVAPTAPPSPPAATPAPTGAVKSNAPPTPAPSQSPAGATDWGTIAPYPDAPLCPDSDAAHDHSQFHTLWDGQRGCRYDHEHGQSPFTPEVAAAFREFDLRALLGGVEIGHTNPSGPMENTHKHGGFKWDVTLQHSAGCETGPGAGNASGIGVDAFAIQYHAFGDYSIEFETRIHSAVGLLRQCRADAPRDSGYVFVNQHQDYGQRVSPYQGSILGYPDNPQPTFDPGIAPYFSVDCVQADNVECRPSLDSIWQRNANASSTWVSRPQAAPLGSTLFSILFRVRDNYQVVDLNDQEYPFTFLFVCSDDGGQTYNPAGCRYNNSTTRIHEVHGEIPAAWDNLEGFDSDPRRGRITADGYVTRFGHLNPDCAAPDVDCHPLRLVNAYVGRYVSTFALVEGKGSFHIDNLPERDIFFCSGQVCAEGEPGAVPSGWIGQSN